MKKVISTLVGASILATGTVAFSAVEANAGTFSSCSADTAGKVSGTVDCTISDDFNQDFLNTTPPTVNIDPGFFGITDWSFEGKIGEDGFGTGSGSGQSGNYGFSGTSGLDYMLVFKSGNGTTLVGYLLGDDITSGTWNTPFTEPPFNFPGNNPKNVSHISVYSSPNSGNPSEPVPEPLTILGAGAAISFGTAFKRKLGKGKKSDEKA